MKIKILFLVILISGTAFTLLGQESSEQRRLKGVVRTPDGESVAGAFIFIDRQVVSTTKSNGKFKIMIPINADSISIYTFDGGFVSESISGLEDIDLVITNPANKLGVNVKVEAQEVFDLGYFRREADKLTTTMNVVRTKDSDKRMYSNIYEMIQGELPGVVVRNTPSRKSIIIRGAGSFGMSNEPLYIVDGSPVSSIENIPPNNVESVNVLKGPATSAYGARGSNGVIVIKMKKGARK